MSERLNCCVLTVSDRCFAKIREDLSGKIAIDILQDSGIDVIEYKIIPDEINKIKDIIQSLVETKKPNLIITTGGTGLSPRDVTPEATKALIEKEIPGISEALRSKGLKKTPYSMLSRGVAGIYRNTLIINLPGKPEAVKEGLELIIEPIKHGLKVLMSGSCG